MLAKKAEIKSGLEALKVNANALKESFDLRSCVVWFNQGLRTAISNELAAINGVLIAFGVATKVIVVI